jgi:hypothetical protein
LLLDCGDAQAARDVLTGTRFSAYINDMNEPACGGGLKSMLDLGPVTYPSWLGEDDLAEFGAYREHAEPASAPARLYREDTIHPTK